MRRINELTLTDKNIVNRDDWIEIGEMEAHNLYRLGLVKRQEGKVTPSCNLYRQYFQRVLSQEVVISCPVEHL
ncbi:MAG: hypothetical protein F6K24_25500 [Okeania sp. SIO2D1]|nr:hypothetical protein [Okeania sp. SIO2D1]